MRSGGGGVRVTRTPEDPKVVVVRRGTKKSVVWSGSRRSSGRKAVEQVGGGVEALSPEEREVELSNSRLLSHWTALTVRPN